MPCCSAIFCSKRSGDLEEETKLSFHRLPSANRDHVLRKKWLQKIRREDISEDQIVWICSKHFLPEDYERDLKAELMGVKSKPKLKSNAVPSLFQFTTTAKKREQSTSRVEKASKKQAVDEALSQSYEIEQSTDDSILLLPRVRTVDKGIDNVPKMVSVRTQYEFKHFLSISSETPPPRIVSPTTPKSGSFLKIKITKPKSRDASTSTNFSFAPNAYISMTEQFPSRIVESECVEEKFEKIRNLDESFCIDDTDTDNLDDTYEIDDDADSSEEDIETPESVPIHLEDKFVVFWSCLLQLLNFCMICKESAFVKNIQKKGTLVIVTLFCKNNHDSKWYSQPLLGKMPAGNLQIAASILYSGNTFERIREMMEIAHISFFSVTTYNFIQKTYLFSAINKIYSTHRELMLDEVREQTELHLLGDGRCDSPGYNAKYGTYTLMDGTTGNILDCYVVHVSEAGNSARMELKGLKILLKSLEESSLEITSLTTDRHIQVRKFMRTEKPEINHQFDIWHVGKNIKKNLTKAAASKQCADLLPWIKAVINHFWWCCASCEGNALELKEKWLSILHHIVNRHRWEGCTIFQKCGHEKLTKRESKEKKWLKLGSPAYLALEKVIKNATLIKDLACLTSFNHTGNLEVYHSLYNKYCPKRLHFSLDGMFARSQLAILDFNAGINGNQATTATGVLRHKQIYSKITKNWVLKSIKEKKDKSYFDDMMEETYYQKTSNESYPLPRTYNPPQYIAPVEKPDKDEAIKNIRTRFVV